MRLAAIALAAGVLALAADASAQKLLLGGSFGVGSGVEGADVGQGTQWRRARTRLELAVDGRVDEDKKQGLELRVFAEIEPHAGLGGGGRYLYYLSPAVTVGAGVVFNLFPHSLVGLDATARILLPLPSKTTRLFLQPSFAVVPLGTDLPGDQVILWGLLTVGIHADL